MLQTRRYVAAEKSDGVRYLLLLGMFDERDPSSTFSVMIDRKYRIFEISVMAAEPFFQGTMMDGELVWEYTNSSSSTSSAVSSSTPTLSSAKPRQLFLVFDVMSVSGERSISQLDYLKRFSELTCLLDTNNDDVMREPDSWQQRAELLAESDKIVCLGNERGLQFRPKPCKWFHNLSQLMRSIDRLQHSSDGLIFMPVDEPVRTGTHRRLLKWKTRHLIDLNLHIDRNDRGELIPSLWFQDEGKEFCTDTETVMVNKEPRKLKLLPSDALNTFFRHHNGSTSCIVECSMVLSKDDGIIGIIVDQLRLDKAYPNNRRTIERTIVNAMENIQLEEFFTLIHETQSGSSDPLITEV
jgi:hypothetical protein